MTERTIAWVDKRGRHSVDGPRKPEDLDLGMEKGKVELNVVLTFGDDAVFRHIGVTLDGWAKKKASMPRYGKVRRIGRISCMKQNSSLVCRGEELERRNKCWQE